MSCFGAVMKLNTTATIEVLNTRVQRMLFAHVIISVLQITVCVLKEQEDALILIGLILYLTVTVLLAYCWRVTRNLEYRLATISEAIIRLSAFVIAMSWLFSMARLIYLSCNFGVSGLEKTRRIIQISVSAFAVLLEGYCANIVYNLYERTVALPFKTKSNRSLSIQIDF
jgi:hypothetical protein